MPSENIEFASIGTAQYVRQLWKECFKDEEAYMHIFFLSKYRHENTLIYTIDGQVVSSLQMLPYTFSFYGQKIPFYYLAGLCTDAKYRNKGYMAELIRKAHEVMAERNIPLTILIPAETSLFEFYGRFGYEQVFQKDNQILSLKKILDKAQNIEEAYRIFDKKFNSLEFCVQKSFDDFKVIVEEYEWEKCPDKTNLAAMARLVDPLPLLDIYAKRNCDQSFTIFLNDAGQNYTQTYRIDNGKVFEVAMQPADLEVNIRILCRLLFGFETGQLPKSFSNRFPEHHPVINLMLE